VFWLNLALLFFELILVSQKKRKAKSFKHFFSIPQKEQAKKLHKGIRANPDPLGSS
jgi:hypothetical protein